MSEMIAVDRAATILLEATPVLPPESVPLDAAFGRVLADDLRADRDVPEFDKALMDGFAVRADDFGAAASLDLGIAATITAGDDPARLAPLAAGSAAPIMTGAPLPPGADAVVPIEATEAAGAGRRRCTRATKGENVAPRGADLRTGDLVLSAGGLIGGAAVGLLATFGRDPVRVGARPRVAVLATGDELVQHDREPGPGRLRNSNGPMLRSLAAGAGAVVIDLGIARDHRAALKAAVARGLDADLLIVSGGVSMGEKDFVTPVLRSAGAEILFDRVAIRPGKPFTTARRGRTVVCACPGNPASSYVIFQVFVRAVIRKMAGHPRPARTPLRARLAAPFRQRPGRAGYWQARARLEPDGVTAEILPTSGSADLAACARANAIVILPADCGAVEAGASVDLLLLDDHDDR